MNSWKGLALILLVYLLGVAVQAQSEEVRGVITDPSGAVIVGASVELRGGDRVIARATTGSQGGYAFHVEHKETSVGKLELTVSSQGFQTVVREVDFAHSQHLSLSVQLRLQPTLEHLVVEAKSQPFHDKLDMSEVRGSPAKDVGEALTAVDGVYKIRQAGIANDIVVRGFQQDNVNVLIDGARLYGACTGHMDPAAYHVDFAEVEHADVDKGAFDVASAGSLGATVEVVTKKPPLGVHVTPSMSLGSFGYYNPSVTASYGNDTLRFLAGYSYRVSDPYRDGSGKSFLAITNFSMAAYNQHAFDINTGWFEAQLTPGDNQKLSLAYTRQQSGVVLYPYDTMDADYDHADRASLKYEITNPTEAVRSVRAQAYFTQVIHFMSDDYRTTAMMNTWSMAADARSRVIGGHIEADIGRDLTVGGEGYYRNWNITAHMNMSGMISSGPAIPDVDTHAFGGFANYHHSFTDRLNFSGGVRFDHDSMSTGTSGLDTDNYFYYQNTRSTHASDNYGSGNVRLTFRLRHSVELFAGAGTTGRVPDAQERYLNYTMMSGGMMMLDVGNPNLPIVRNTESTAGAVVRRGSSYIKPTLFYSDVNNYSLVNNQPLLNMSGMMPSSTRSYTNVDAHIYGGEISYAFRLPADFSLTGGGSYSKGTNERKPKAGVLSSNLPEMPPMRTWIALRYTHKFGFAEIGGTGVARQSLVDTDLNESPTAGHGLMDVKFGLRYWKLQASLVLDNLLNNYYTEHLSYFRDPFASGVHVPEPERNFFGQLLVNF
jgi:iron complex outermembrane receptor protein